MNTPIDQDALPVLECGGYIIVREEDQEICGAHVCQATAVAMATEMAHEDEEDYAVWPAEPRLVNEWDSWCWTTVECLVNGKVVDLAVIEGEEAYLAECEA